MTLWPKHCRMRGRSWALITATYRSLAIDVLFGLQSNGNIRILSFQRGTTLKFHKNFRTFLFKFLGQSHGVIISVQPIKKHSRNGGRSLSFCLFTASSLGAVVPGRSCPCLLMFVDPACLCAHHHQQLRRTVPTIAWELAGFPSRERKADNSAGTSNAGPFLLIYVLKACVLGISPRSQTYVVSK